MPTLTPRILAACTWYAGATVLTLKSISLLSEANRSSSQDPMWSWLSVATGLVVGALKARFIIIPACRRNLARIDDLPAPRAWQFFRPWSFLVLALMVTAGAVLSRFAHGRPPLLIGVAALDLAIAVALLASSFLFWARARPARNNKQHTAESETDSI